MLLSLNKLEVEMVIGDMPEERTRTQKVRIDAEFEVPEKAADTDELGDTVDYAALKERIETELKTAAPKLIERAAKIAYESVKEFGPRKIKVTKSGAIKGLESASVEYP